MALNCILDIARYREDIISLWEECFGDDRAYIEFFLDSCPNKVCIGSVADGKPVSMLFLLNGELNGFSCKYIYAACTSIDCRGRGLMGELIEYAKSCCQDIEADFLFLVPAEDSLYDYYSRFGFVTKMKRAGYTLNGGLKSFDEFKTTDIKKIAQRRKKLLSVIDRFVFDMATTEYSVKEFLRTGGEIYSRDGETGFLAFVVRDGKNAVVKELLLDYYDKITIILGLFENLSAENVYIQAPLVYNNTDIGCIGTKCGMLYPVTNKAKDFINSKDIFYSGMYLD